MNASPAATGKNDGFERFLRHCARYWALAPRVYPRGVMKFKSIEEAQAARVEVATRRVTGSGNDRP